MCKKVPLSAKGQCLNHGTAVSVCLPVWWRFREMDKLKC